MAKIPKKTNTKAAHQPDPANELARLAYLKFVKRGCVHGRDVDEKELAAKSPSKS